jgi:hypothetical protein
MKDTTANTGLRLVDIEPRLRDWLSTCMACGREMAPCLVRAASPRCHDCRDSKAPLRADLVDERLAA